MSLLPSITIEYTDDDLLVKLVVQRASYQMGLVRTLLLQDSFKARKDPEGFREATLFERAGDIMSVMFYPNMIAAVAEQEGFTTWPIPLEEFLGLPEELMVQWERAVFELNPKWAPEETEKEGEQKVLDAAEVAKKTIGSGESLTTQTVNPK